LNNKKNIRNASSKNIADFSFYLIKSDLVPPPLFCRISALDLWSLATEGTQEFGSIIKREFATPIVAKRQKVRYFYTKIKHFFSGGNYKFPFYPKAEFGNSA
jgi:hypothetical protein